MQPGLRYATVLKPKSLKIVNHWEILLALKYFSIFQIGL